MGVASTQLMYKKEVVGSENSWLQRLEQVKITAVKGSALNLTPLTNLFEDVKGDIKILVQSQLD